MARYKNVTRTASVQWALKFWLNTVRNFDEQVYDSDFFDIIAYNLERDEVAAVISGNIDAKDLKCLTDAKEEKLELDRDCVGFMLWSRARRMSVSSAASVACAGSSGSTPWRRMC